MSDKRAFFKLRVFLFACVLAAYGICALFYRDEIDRRLNLLRAEPPAGDAPLKIHYIDVGQGDATFIEFPDGKNMLVDAGPSAGRAKLLDYFQNRLTGVTGLDYIVLTHSDADHCDNFPAVLEKYPLRRGGRIYRPNQRAVWDNGVDGEAFSEPADGKTGFEGFWGGSGLISKPSLTYSRAVKSFYGQREYIDGGASVIVTDSRPLPQPKRVLNDTLTLYAETDIFGDVNGNGVFDRDTDYVVRFYGPTRAHFSDSNDYSPVFTVNYAGRRALFSGDAEKTAEAEFVRVTAEFKADGAANGDRLFDFDAGEEIFGRGVDIIKLGHHGSATSCGPEYLKVVLPSDNSATFAVASANRNGNNYNHPSPVTIARLTDDFGFKPENIWVTETSGTAVAGLAPEGVTRGGGGGAARENELVQFATLGAVAVGIVFVLLFCLKISVKATK